jgi:hypothetical protein
MSEFTMPSMFSLPIRTLRQTWLAGAMLLLCGLALAQVPVPNRFEEDFDDDTKPWQEIALQLPAAPASENLLPFQAGAAATQSFAIDAKSLTVGSDGVVRYTLVATSQGGAKSISYEGIRCESFERKLYAFGHANGSWSRSRRDKWEPIPRVVANFQHGTLAREYFCADKQVAGPAEKIIERIRLQRPLNPQSGA